MSLFDDLRITAGALLLELGTVVTLRRLSRVYDPDTRTTTETVASHAGRGALVSPQGQSSQGERAVDAATMTQQYAVVGSLPTGVAPAVDDQLVVAGRTFRINGVTPVQPDGAPIVWRLALADS